MPPKRAFLRTVWSCPAQSWQTQCSVRGSPIPMRACIFSASAYVPIQAAREDTVATPTAAGRAPLGTTPVDGSSGLWLLWFHHCNCRWRTQLTMSCYFLLVLRFTNLISHLPTHIFQQTWLSSSFIHVSPSKNSFTLKKWESFDFAPVFFNGSIESYGKLCGFF